MLLDQLIKDNVDVLDKKFNSRLIEIENKIDDIGSDVKEIKNTLKGLKW